MAVFLIIIFVGKMVESKKALPKEPRGNLNYGSCYYPTLPPAGIMDNAAYAQDLADQSWQENVIDNYSQPKIETSEGSKYSDYYPGRRNSVKIMSQDRSIQKRGNLRSAAQSK